MCAIIIKIIFKVELMPLGGNNNLFEDDSLSVLEVGSWTPMKHEKFRYYCSMFATSMKNKWDKRVYLDLFSGCGKCSVRDSNQIVPGSPLLALDVEDSFDLYIFCEKDKVFISVLKERVANYFPSKTCKFVCGDINTNLARLFEEMPAFSKENRGLTFCFVDPFKMGDLDFDTIRSIQEKIIVDFLVLIPSFTDINRNEHNYTRDSNNSLDRYLGTDTWRAKWQSPQRHRMSFGDFIAQEFCLQMRDLQYLYEGPGDLKLIRGENNSPMYHLAFFSKNAKGLEFWRETMAKTERQRTLWPRGEF